MSTLRTCSILLTIASLSYAAGTNATLTMLRGKSCAAVVVSIDGRALKSPQQQISLAPGRHVLSLRVTDALGRFPTADAPLDTTFDAGHRYTFQAELSNTGKLDGRLTDLTKEKEKRSHR